MLIYNSMTRSLEAFVPGNPDQVSMYVCGPTVYDTPHLGNARPAVVFDVLYRVLREKHASVVYARNFTDIDDKIMQRARENGEDIGVLTARTIAEYHEIMDTLSVMRPPLEPRATNYISAMKGMIAELMLFGHAYESQGHVLFDVSSYPDHGKLSAHQQSDLIQNHRVEEASYKRNQADFVLWKPSAPDEPGWDSLWGRGRPGWHIECSAMIRSIFGERSERSAIEAFNVERTGGKYVCEDPTDIRHAALDIHAGGGDLRFPHHDCEISQSFCANNAPLARYWMHNGMLTVGGQKMAKSAGNFFTVRDLINQGWTGPEIRFALLQTHYRSPLDWNNDVMQSARSALMRLHGAVRRYENIDTVEPQFSENPALVALESDLNTPASIAALHVAAGELNSGVGITKNLGILRTGLRFLGLEDRAVSVMTTEELRLFEERRAARAKRDFDESDRLRKLLAKSGIIVEDTKTETTWRRSKIDA